MEEKISAEKALELRTFIREHCQELEAELLIHYKAKDFFDLNEKDSENIYRTACEWANLVNAVIALDDKDHATLMSYIPMLMVDGERMYSMQDLFRAYLKLKNIPYEQ